MKTRTLCGALILLLLSAPLTASLCGNCMPEHCTSLNNAETSTASENTASELTNGDSIASELTNGDNTNGDNTNGDNTAKEPAASETSHCHAMDSAPQTEASSQGIENVDGMSTHEAPAPCHGMEIASAECCAIAAVPKSETEAAPASSISLQVGLEAAVQIEVPTNAFERQDRRRSHLPLPVPRSLFTLHSTFLI